MKKYLLSSMTLLFIAGQALASNGIYVAPKVGWSDGEISGIDFEYRYSDLSVLEAGLFPEKDNSNTSVVAWGGAVGYKYDSWKIPMRMETEYLYRNRYKWNSGICTADEGCRNADSATINSTIDSQTILANFYLDFPFQQMFAVFIGAGLGAALNFTSSTATFLEPGGAESAHGHAHDYAFSWMATAGLTFNPLDWLAIDLSYRYSDLGDIDWMTDNSVAFGGDGGMALAPPLHATSLSSLNTNTFAAQEVYLGFRFQIPDFAKL